MNKHILVVSGHVGDFVWRSGGTIASYAKMGCEVHLLVFTLGIRGESNGYWKSEGANYEKARVLRRKEGEEAAKILGIKTVEIHDFVDYPLELDRARIEMIVKKIREHKIDIVITHDHKTDLFNADHTLIGNTINMACAMASSSSLALDNLEPIPRPSVYGFEPHNPEFCDFSPDVFVDITEVIDIKKQAMRLYVKTQKNMIEPYITKSKIRAFQSQKARCEYAEAFSIIYSANNFYL